jgi:PhzF family phenazine biosynthesis protein
MPAQPETIPMKQRPFKQVDVFTATAYQGNPLAVVLDGSGLSDVQMQQFARWTNLSETTFVLPATQAGADYRVRIFTPGGELPFAGHPTLGSCHAWLQAGGQPHSSEFVVQQCQVGLVRIRRAGEQQAFAAPALQRSTPDAALLAQVLRALGLQGSQVKATQLLNNGPVWLGLLLDNPGTVLQLAPDHTALKDLGIKVGVVAPWETSSASHMIARSNPEARAFAGSGEPGAEADFEVRAFAAAIGIAEDPVTGSLNASLAQWLTAEGLAPNQYVASQGTCLERSGRVHITRDSGGQVWVGGQTVTCIDGQVTL